MSAPTPPEDPSGSPAQPPQRGARYWLLAVLASAVGLVVVYVLYDRGILPIAGPFALIALLPLLLPIMERGQRKKAERVERRRQRREG